MMGITLANAVVVFAPAGIFAAIIGLVRGRSNWALLGLLFVLFTADFVVLRITDIWPETHVVPSHWNYPGKIASLLFGLLVLAALPRRLYDQIGLFRWPNARRWMALAIPAVAVIAFAVSTARFGDPAFNWDNVIYQGTLPGFDEELHYRGLWWVLFASFLEPERQDDGRIPWLTLLVTSGLFGWAHAASFDPAIGLVFDFDKFQGPAIIGACLGLTQALGRAVWIPMVVHNLFNVVRFV